MDLQRERRTKTGRQHRAIGGLHSPRQADVPYGAPVDDERRAARRRAHVRRPLGDATHANWTGDRVHVEKTTHRISTPQHGDAVAQ